MVMQENHSYDSYFGMLGRGDGFKLDAKRRPLASNPDAHGNPVRAFHMATTCQSHSLTQNWNSSHIQWNDGKLDGFVRSPSGAAAMGYWDGTDLPFYYGLANTFPLCDRWFASVLGQTHPNRRFLLCGSALGTINTIVGENDVPAAEERHDRRDAQPVRHLVARLQHGHPFAVPLPAGVTPRTTTRARRSTSSSPTPPPASCRRSASSSRTERRRAKKTRRTSRWARRSPRRS